ncbi:MAG: hypothetical protein KF761_04110 [Salinibacterium sp.]|nr:hypothetical protein [Salinibacterium sp.]
MNTTRISDTEAFELAHGRVPARPDLDQLADLLAEYRSAAIGSAPRPSAALATRLDLSATPIVMQRDAVADGEATGSGARRTVSGLFGLGVTVTIILGAASGAAAVVSAGSAGLLPSGAQDAFNQIVSLVVPPGVVGPETTDEGEAPSDRTKTSTTPEAVGGTGTGANSSTVGTADVGTGKVDLHDTTGIVDLPTTGVVGDVGSAVADTTKSVEAVTETVTETVSESVSESVSGIPTGTLNKVKGILP